MGPVPNRDDFSLLMAAAQAGDGAAYEAVLRLIAEAVLRMVRRQRGFLGADAVEDLVQDVLLSVHAVRATYDARRPFLPWLVAIVRNRLADHARRYARTAAHEVVVDDLDVTFSSNDANLLESRLVGSEALRAAIEALPPGQRKAIELLKLREMSLKEAAAAAGTTVGAMKVATHRAIAELRRRLKTS
jgi:RNA polymerase sigma-70 factor (ECF subfamily)